MTTTEKKEPVKEVDLLGGFDEDTNAFGGSNSGGPGIEKALPSLSGFSAGTEVDDDFADFQAAPSASTPSTTTASNPSKPNLMEMLNSPPAMRPTAGHFSTSSFSQSSSVQPQLGFSNNANPLGAMPRQAPAPTQTALFSQPTLTAASPPMSRPPQPTATSTSTSKPTGNFDDLWTMSLGGGVGGVKPAATSGTKSIKDLEKEKASAGIWGVDQKKPVGQFDFGNFGGSAANASSPAGGAGDDLLL
jgi:epsin